MAKTRLGLRILGSGAIFVAVAVVLGIVYSPVILTLWISGWNFGFVAFLMCCVFYLVWITPAILTAAKRKLMPLSSETDEKGTNGR